MGEIAPAGFAPVSRHLCRCSHPPTSHMQVVALSTGGGFGLQPKGPCHECGAPACPSYRPGPAPEAAARATHPLKS